MNIGIVKENRHSESRVSLTPDSISKLIKLGNHKFSIVKDAGIKSGFENKEYQDSGVQIIENNKQLILNNQLIISVNPIENSYYKHFSPQSILISNFETFSDTKCVQLLIQNNITGLALERIPRIARAQSMDVLSSQASVSGYKSVLIAASKLNKYFPMLMTAAGTIPPAKILVLGAGVAGLQAIATAKRLGARVDAFDTRPVVEDQVKSLGAKFIKIDIGETGQTDQGYAKELTEGQIKMQQEGMKKICSQADVVITTAQVFGRPAPLIITKEMIKAMKPGSVIVDMAVTTGGNVEGSVVDSVEVINEVKIIGMSNLPGEVAYHASQVYGTNLCNMVDEFWDSEAKSFSMDITDEILSSCVVTHEGQIVNKILLGS